MPEQAAGEAVEDDQAEELRLSVASDATDRVVEELAPASASASMQGVVVTEWEDIRPGARATSGNTRPTNGVYERERSCLRRDDASGRLRLCQTTPFVCF